MKRYPKNSKGFTLIELMMAIVVFSVGIAAALQAIHFSNVLSIEAKERTIALHDARSVLERIKVTSITTLPQNTVVNASSLWTDLAAVTSNSLPRETITVRGDNSTTLRTMTVTVTWRGGQERLKTVEIMTLKSIFNG